MKKLLLTSALVAISAPAMAKPPLYLTIGAGVTHTSESDWDDGTDTGTFDIDNAANFAAAFGGVYNNARVELEVSYRSPDVSEITIDGVGSADIDGELKTWAFLLNGYYDFLEGNKFRPFVSAGIGAAHHKGEVSGGGVTFDSSDTVLAYQLGAGATYSVNEQVGIFGGLRYLGSSDADFDGLESEYDATEARAGLRFNF